MEIKKDKTEKKLRPWLSEWVKDYQVHRWASLLKKKLRPLLISHSRAHFIPLQKLNITKIKPNIRQTGYLELDIRSADIVGQISDIWLEI